MEMDQSNIIYNQETKQLVVRKGNEYIPLLKAENVHRDSFFHLRKQLIMLGCPKEEVLSVAKRLCMDILQTDSEEKYLQHVLEHAYRQCKQNIVAGCDPYPVQDIQNHEYSHLNLFSSIYGFEMEYLKSRCIFNEIADIGCGEGIFIRLAKEDGLHVTGYEVKKPLFSHDVKIHVIEDFYDINEPYKCIIYNHVLEHISIRPDVYLSLVIDHFEKSKMKDKLRLIFIALPMHLHIQSHLVSKHFWVCTDENFLDDDFKSSLPLYDLKIFNPAKAFSDIAKRYNYKLFINDKIGVYVFEK